MSYETTVVSDGYLLTPLVLPPLLGMGSASLADSFAGNDMITWYVCVFVCVCVCVMGGGRKECMMMEGSNFKGSGHIHVCSSNTFLHSSNSESVMTSCFMTRGRGSRSCNVHRNISCVSHMTFDLSNLLGSLPVPV